MYDYADAEYEGSGVEEPDRSDPCNKYPRWELLAAVGLPTYTYYNDGGKTKKHRIELVRALVQCPASEIFVNYANEHGATPLLRATVLGDSEIVAELLRHPTVNVNQGTVPDGMTALFAASLEGRAEIVELLLARSDTEVNLPRVDDSEGMSPLYVASLKEASINDVSSQGSSGVTEMQM